ncbi:MAG: phenylalanine--tRNA ligase subunit beta [Flavobacteriales bacterium]|nr:phenylalanine--tRNA ligase subunit beta [Flavobacteriales bacterium]
MRISWNWLKTLIDLDGLSPREVADVLTSIGLEVESVEPLEPVKGMLTGVVVGHVLECAKHPDADRLSITRVDVGGGEHLQIVCGAPNVAEGQKVLVALVGATLYMTDGNSIVIKKSKIRGVESHGMICAEDELGLGQSHAGIMVLDPEARIGTAAADVLGLRADHVFEIGLTPNRADAMSHLGVARDLAAALRYRTGREVSARMPDVSAFTKDDDARRVSVDVQAPHAAPRYAGLTLTNVKVGPSPEWLRERLNSIGLKPINNVVDVTNFVQHELGQPLHAFDADRIADGKIIVRYMPAGTAFVTLDGKERKLDAEDLMIADPNGPLCIAGVFGGLASGVTEGTTAVFLESACFDAISVRRTARRHALNTDASFRFERGVDPEITLVAMERAAMLLREVAGAKVSSDITDLLAHEIPWRHVKVHFANVDRLCGVAIGHDDVVRILQLLDCRIASRTERMVEVQVPPYRVDVHREADLVEEVLRIHGFDRIPVPERLMVPAVMKDTATLEGLQQTLAGHLAARGFNEVMTPSLVNGERTMKLGAATESDLVRLLNPLSNELDVLRPTMLFGLLGAAVHNIARQRRDLRLFEKGRVYVSENGSTREEDRTALLVTGRRWRERWDAEDDRSASGDVKAEVELLVERLGIEGMTAQPVEHPLLDGAVGIQRKNVTLAVIGAVKPVVAKAFDVAQPVFFAELNDAVWLQQIASKRITYAEVSRFPSVRRDLSLLLDKGVTYAQLEKLALQAERKLLLSVDLFDVYEGDKLPAGKKSYALSFMLQDAEKTLTDEKVDKAMRRIRATFEKEVGAELRG